MCVCVGKATDVNPNAGDPIVIPIASSPDLRPPIHVVSGQLAIYKTQKS